MPPSPSEQSANLKRGVPIILGYLGAYLGIGFGFPWVVGEPLLPYTFRTLGLLQDKEEDGDRGRDRARGAHDSDGAAR